MNNTDTTNYVIQCTDHASGKLGDFTFNASDADRDGYFTATSPIFGDLQQLFNWARDTGIKLEFRMYLFPKTLDEYEASRERFNKQRSL